MLLGYLVSMQDDTIALIAPFELWREERVLHLSFGSSSSIGISEIKEVLRLISALDPVNERLVVVHSDGNVSISADARLLLSRSCKGDLHRSVAFIADSLSARLTGDMFAILNRPRFPFRVVSSVREAMKWAQEGNVVD